MKPVIFISAVSEEFRDLRRDVADEVRKLGYDPHTRETLPTLEGDLRQALREQIDLCEGVIQIVGEGYGAEPPVEDEIFGRCSYTQFEYHYARLKGKKLWVFFAADGDAVGRDKKVSQLDLPKLDQDHPDPLGDQSERRNLQQRYIAYLRGNGQIRHPFFGKLDLLRQIASVRDELKALRQEWKNVQGQISQITRGVRVTFWGIVGVALLVLMVLGVSMPRFTCALPFMSIACKNFGLDEQKKQNEKILTKIDEQSVEIKELQGTLEMLLEQRGLQNPSAVENFANDLQEPSSSPRGALALERFRQGEEREALAAFDSLPGVPARVVANLALIALDRGKLEIEEVIARFEALARQEDSDPWIQQVLSELRQRSNSNGDAEDSFGRQHSAADVSQSQIVASEEKDASWQSGPSLSRPPPPPAETTFRFTDAREAAIDVNTPVLNEKARLEDFALFRDCAECPEMVVIPAGIFMMGSVESEAQSHSDERPKHRVSVPAFALAATEVTFSQWDACVLASGCSHWPDDRGWGRGDRPVIDVSWEDAQEYLRWLSRKTGAEYRLPSETEWEYAARANTQTRFHTGDCITTDQANFEGNYPPSGCRGGEYREKTAVVKSFAANAFGLYDVHGNVWEWVVDCWNDSYEGAPGDGSAWMTGDCGRAVLRGGSWLYGGRSLRSASRDWNSRANRNLNTGFRPARSVAL